MVLCLAFNSGAGAVAGVGCRDGDRSSRIDPGQVSELAKIGEWFFEAIAMVQLSMILLAAPAATAGAFCSEMARGHVCLMLVSGINSAQIVLGTLGARLLHMLGAVACVVPVLCVASSLGGVPPQALVRLELVTVGTAVLGCAVALAISIVSRRLHETLTATYALLAGWVMGYGILFMIRFTAAGRLVPAGWPAWFLDVNPYWLALEPIVSPGTYQPVEEWKFLASTTGLALGIAAVAAWRLKASALAEFSPLRRRSWLSRLPFFRSIVSLDACPVFWRECRSAQSSFWLRLLWGFYIVGALVFTVLAVIECTTAGTGARSGRARSTAFRLRLAWVCSACSLQPLWPRSGQGAVSTFCSRRRSRLAPWFWASGLLATALCPSWHCCPPPWRRLMLWTLQRWPGVLLVVGMMLANGAAVTSLGIALATWVPRVDRALILSAAASVLITVGWIPLMLLLFRGWGAGHRPGHGEPSLRGRADHFRPGHGFLCRLAAAREMGLDLDSCL